MPRHTKHEPPKDRRELGYPGGRGRQQEAGYPRYSDELSDPRRPHGRRREGVSGDHYQDPAGDDPQVQPKERRRRS